MIPDRFRLRNYRQKVTYLAAGILIAAVTLYLALPIVALFLQMTPGLFFATLNNPDVVSALWLSLFTTCITLTIVVLVGTPFAYFHSRYSYPGKMIVDTLIDLPLVLPPAVAGVALLVLWGRVGILGMYLNMYGITIAFTTLAVIMAQIFVASPFYLRQAKSLFEQVLPGIRADRQDSWCFVTPDPHQGHRSYDSRWPDFRCSHDLWTCTWRIWGDYHVCR